LTTTRWPFGFFAESEPATDFLEQGSRHGKQVIKYPSSAVIGGFHISYSPIFPNDKILEMASSALNVLKDLLRFFTGLCFPPYARFKIIQQMELHMVHQTCGNFIGDPSRSGSSLALAAGGTSTVSIFPFNPIPPGVRTRFPADGLARSGAMVYPPLLIVPFFKHGIPIHSRGERHSNYCPNQT